MGLAASQARFLGLTARKSNVEYQGQQINQARTALSNEIMNLYQKYNNLEVPVPPSKTDYTKTTYKMDSTANGYEVSSFSKIPSGEYEGYYNVILSYDEDVPVAYSYMTENFIATVTKDSKGVYQKLNFVVGTDTYSYDSEDTKNSTITKITKDYEKYPGLQTLIDAGKFSEGDIIYMYLKNNVGYYTSESELDAAFVNGGDRYDGRYTFEYQGVKPKTNTINAIGAIDQDKSGRLSSIYVVECEDDPSLVNNSYAISVSSYEDEDGYTDAMNKYEYDHEVYQREVELINKKTEKIQAEDKALELKLNQLDTEQNALSTEMDSISKVIEDTIESVYKTYNS